MLANLAFYHRVKENILTANTQTLDDLTSKTAISAARSRGLEFDLNGKLTENLSVNAAYASTDTEITQDNTDSIDSAPPRADIIPGAPRT